MRRALARGTGWALVTIDRRAIISGVVKGLAEPIELPPRMDRRIRAQDMRWTAPPPGARRP